VLDPRGHRKQYRSNEYFHHLIKNLRNSHSKKKLGFPRQKGAEILLGEKDENRHKDIGMRI